MFKKYGGTLIYSGKDEHGIVEVVDTPSTRSLHLGTSIQQSSLLFDDPFALEMEYNKVMMSPLVYNPHPKKVLFLGLGGGAKPKFLWKHFPDCHVDVVEISPLVIEVSHRFFFVPQDKRLQIFCNDALRFLQSPTSSLYDYLWIDLYISDQISPVIAKESFFPLCKQKLQKEGILIWNMWQHGPQDQQREMLASLSNVFGKDYTTLTNEESPNLVLVI